MQLIADGVIAPDPPTVRPLAATVEVLAAMERRETTGKWVLIP